MFKRSQTPALTYISATTEIQGTLHVEGNLRVDGIIHGTVEVRGDMEISQSGLVEGPELRANNIVVQGVVKSRVVAEGRLTLTRTARLEGDVTAHSLDIEAGAHYLGHIATNDNDIDNDMKSLPLAPSYPELVGQEVPPPEHSIENSGLR
ncbi:bactofilin family protein [Leptolyngbya ohadii]|uniref:bactofilin family protein n=1 Tax=Leptolyngbya ohadii TaxID=1962290 RepID=UPI000B599FC2|nr:polymer-forming cytoskeletal protein [Leptolyngbya ohadii]